MYVIFLKSLRFKDFRYDIGDDKDKDMMDMKSGGWVIDSFSPSRPIDQWSVSFVSPLVHPPTSGAF